MKPQSLILAVLGTLWLSFPAGVGRASTAYIIRVVHLTAP